MRSLLSTSFAAVVFTCLASNAHAQEPAPPTEVTVAGTKLGQTAGSAHVIRSDKLERYEYDDPNAVLAQVPGVYSRGEDGIGLRPNIGIRGVNPDRSKKLTLLEDGVPFAPAPYTASAAYYFPLITRMSSVRVLKGPAAVAYGPQTIGGAIDLITRPIPSKTSGAIDLAGGQYGYGKMHGWVGSSDDQIGFLVEGVHLRSDGFKELPNGANTGFYRNEWMFKGSYVLDPKASIRNELRLKAGYSDEDSNETYLGLSDADFRANPDRRYAASQLDHMKWHRTSIAITHVMEPGGGLTVTTTAYRSDLSRVWRKANHFRGADLFEVTRDPKSPRNGVFASLLRGESNSGGGDETLFVGPNEREFVVQGVESRVRFDAKTGPIAHRVEYGLRLHQDSIARRHSENGFDLTNGQLLPDGGPTIVTAYNEASTEALAMHVIDAISWKNLTLTPGVRIEAMRQSFTDKTGVQAHEGVLTQAVLPGAGAFYAFTKDFGALAGVYRGFSPPVPGSGQNAKPELSVNYEAGARYARKRARLEVIGFYNDYSNLTDVCTLSSGCVATNLDRQFDAGRARIYGVEVFAEHVLPLGSALKVPFDVAYTATRAEFLRDFSSDDPIFGNVKRGDEVPYVPRHELHASAGLEHARAGGNIGMTYVSSMREQAGSASLSHSLATDAQLLFDERFIVSRRPYGARPNAPRWAQVGLKATF
jgi:Fe(3+) dicitrate transport protein